MKYVVILGDGMADQPIKELGGKTPLEAAHTPVMDRLARDGRLGMLSTVPQGFTPGSDVANLGVLGYDASAALEGRGVLEAASMGVNVPDGTVAMRCNLVCIDNQGRLKNHSAGHISTEEATELIEFLQKSLGNDKVTFKPGVSYRHLLLINNADKNIICTPPHDVPGTLFNEVLPTAAPDNEEANATAQLVNTLIAKSQELLKNHPVNIDRIARGLDPANSIWPWSPGYRPSMRPMNELWPIKRGAVITAVDLIRGIGVYAGLERINVKGATGLYDTNYEGKAQAAINALHNGCDFVFVHVEASDEAGHDGDVALKMRTIEYLDSRLISHIVNAVEDMDEPVTLAVLPDHPTPCAIRTHTSRPVPFLIMRPGASPDSANTFSEASAANGSYGLLSGNKFMKALFNI